MKELSLYQKIAFVILCVGAFTNTLTLFPHITLIRLCVPVVLCCLLFSERVRLDSAFYVIISFFFTYIVYTLFVTLCYGRGFTLPDIANFLFILPMVLSALWLFCIAPRDCLRILYWFCGINLAVSLGLAVTEVVTNWHLPMSNMYLPEKVMIVAEHNQIFPTGFYHNKNDFAIVIALCFCYLMAYRIHFIKDRKRWADWLFLGLCVACLVLTRCRTSLIAILIFCAFLQRGFIFRHKVFFGIAGALCLVAGAVWLLFFADLSVSTRENLYLYSFASLFDSYGLGFGLGGDRYYFTALDNYTLFEKVTNTHAYLLDFLITSGIFFFVGYLLLLFYLMRRMAKTKGRNEFWFLIPTYVFLLFAPSSASHLWIHYIFLSAIVGYMVMPQTIEEPRPACAMAGRGMNCCVSMEKMLYLLFFPVLLFSPFIPVAGFSFRFSASDFLLVLVTLVILKNGWWRKHLKVLAAFSVIALYLFVTILVNGLFAVTNSYFEIYAILKLFLFYIFFAEMNPEMDLSMVFNICFIGLVCFNILHYFNVFDFNTHIMPSYCGDNNIQLKYFGYDSSGRPCTRRALGVMGNPNNNALLFLFFMILYAPRREWKKLTVLFFFIALTCFLCCQSRTGMVACAVVLLCNYLFAGIPLRRVIPQVVAIVGYSAFVLNFAEIALWLHIPLPVRSMNYSLSLLDGSALASHSWEERKRMWSYLLSMWTEHPLFGYGPDKNFFYENKLFAENEYILMLWRYGIFGLLMYLSLYLQPLIRVLKWIRSNENARRTAMLLTAFAVAALTNHPVLCTKLAILLVFLLASVKDLPFPFVRKERSALVENIENKEIE